MRERKKTAVHGTLEMIPLAWKFNSKQLLCKTRNSRMNIIETRAVLNMVKMGQMGGPGIKLIVNFKQICEKELNSRTNTKKVSSARGTLGYKKMYQSKWNLDSPCSVVFLASHTRFDRFVENVDKLKI